MGIFTSVRFSFIFPLVYLRLSDGNFYRLSSKSVHGRGVQIGIEYWVRIDLDTSGPWCGRFIVMNPSIHHLKMIILVYRPNSAILSMVKNRSIRPL